MHLLKGPVLLFLAAGIWGCPGNREERRALAKAESASLEKSVSQLLDLAKELVFLERAYIPDGGSIEFTFRTDTGVEFRLDALHDDFHQGPGPQAFRIDARSLGKGEFIVDRASSVEGRLLSLLETCRYRETPDDPQGWPKPTTASRDWILSRLKNRSIPWGKCP
jgi:hypothetical protein